MASDELSSSRDTHVSHANKAVDSPFHRGAFLEPERHSTQNVNDLPGIASMKLPSNWLEFQQNSQFTDATMFRPNASDYTQISYTGNKYGVDKTSVETFKNVVNADLPTPRILYSEKLNQTSEKQNQLIKELKGALGHTQVGDNQVTSSGSRTPAFHLDSATVETINGKKVIAVDGWFTQLDEYAEIKMDENGPVKRHYTGVFFEDSQSKSDMPPIKALYLLADDNVSFISNKATFRNALKSIEWK